jgi:hypothetical protein
MSKRPELTAAERALPYAKFYDLPITPIPEEKLAVVETIYIDNGGPILHYLVHDPAAGRYLEVTLGWRAEHLEYYVVRPIHPDDHRHILSEFQRALDDWTEEYVGWFGRKVLGITRVL